MLPTIIVVYIFGLETVLESDVLEMKLERSDLDGSEDDSWKKNLGRVKRGRNGVASM